MSTRLSTYGVMRLLINMFHESSVTDRINVYKITDSGRQTLKTQAGLLQNAAMHMHAYYCNFTPQQSKSVK